MKLLGARAEEGRKDGAEGEGEAEAQGRHRPDIPARHPTHLQQPGQGVP